MSYSIQPSNGDACVISYLGTNNKKSFLGLPSLVEAGKREGKKKGDWNRLGFQDFMDAKVLRIHWHDKKPVFSVDFDPRDPDRFVTAGGDNTIRVWSVFR